jgi:hypothetical protein
MTELEQRRWRTRLAACEHRAVLPWVRQVARLAQAAEDGDAYRHALRVAARLGAEVDALDADLCALDPDWAEEVLARFYAAHPDGTINWARRTS